MHKVRAFVRSCDDPLVGDGERNGKGKGRTYDFYPLFPSKTLHKMV